MSSRKLPHRSPAAPPAARGRRLKVLCVTPLGLDGRGGIDRLYRYLRDLPALPADDVEIRYFASRGEVPGALWLATFPARLAAFAATMAAHRPDVVHVNFANGGSLPRKLAIIRVARAFGVPVVSHFHCTYPADDVARGNLAGRMFDAICRSSAEIVAIGNVARRRFVEDAKLDPARVHVVPNGGPDIGVGLALPKGGPKLRILFAGRLGPHKGSSVLVAALALLRDRADWHCTLAGDGDVEGCRAEVEAAGLGQRVALTGWIAADALHGLMRDADIVVLPSIQEVMPMSLIEGAAAGAALLATPVGEVGDVLLEGRNGLVIDRRPETVADRLRRLLDDRDMLARMQSASRDLYEASFRIEVFAERLAAVWRAAAAR